MENKRDVHVKINPYKNLVIAIILPVILGPIGLLYSSFLGSIIMLFLFFAFSLLSLVGLKLSFFYILFWMISVVWSAGSAIRYNKKINKIFIPELSAKDNAVK